MLHSTAVSADRLMVAGRWMMSIRRLDVRRVGPVALAVVVVATATLVSSLAQFTSLTPTPPSSLSAAQLNPYIPDAVTAARQGATTCLVSWTPSTTPSPPASLTYDVTDGTGTVVATGVPGTSATITVPATAVTPTVRARAGGWTSSLERTSATACAGEPFPPTGVTATPGDSSAAVSWTPAGGPAASSYAVTATPASGTVVTCPATAPATTCTLSGLVNGLRYTVTVTATNASGTSAASAPTTVTSYPAVMAGTDSVLWLDAADPGSLFSDPGCTSVAAAGATVGCWQDRSASGADGTRTAPAERPTVRGNQINGLPAVRFTTGTRLTGADVFGGSTRDMQFFFVSRENASSAGTLVRFNTTGPGRVLVHAPYNVDDRWIFDAGTCCTADRSQSVVAATALGATTLFTGWKDNATGRNGFRLNAGTVYNSPSNSTAATTTGFELNNDSTDHDIAELVTFDRRLSAVEERAVESYLARKWGRAITPDAPTGVTPAVSGTSATVSWTPPAWNGGAAISGYTATATPASGGGAARTCTATAPATSCTLSGLADGTEYDLSVTAANIHGTGPGSGAVPLLTGAPHAGDLALWLDAAAPSTLFTDTAGTTRAGTGQEVHRWADRSGNNRHAIKGVNAVTGATRTSNAVNGRTAMRFTRTAREFYDVTAPGIGAVGSADRTLIVVGAARTVRGTSSDEDGGAFAVWPGNHSGLGAFGPVSPDAVVDQISSEAFDTADQALVSRTATAADVPQAMTARLHTTGGLVRNDLSVNGRQTISSTSAGSGAWRSYSDLLRIGAGNEFSSYRWRLDGDIAEVLLYNRALSATEQRTAESYLAAKWGLTLAPDAPTAVTGTGGANQVAVTWTAPADTGGAPVTSYMATASPSGATCTATPPSTGCTITGLPNGTAYTVTVTATNSAGTGRASAPSAPVSTVPYATAPTGVTALTSGSRMEVAWTAPGDTGGTPISDYTVQYRVQGATPWITATDAVSTHTVAIVTGLSAGTTYETRVAAVNGSGTGAWSTPAQSAPGQAWRPTHLPGGAAVWFDADDPGTIASTAGRVDRWLDSSGNGRDATQTGGFRPSIVAASLGGRASVQFGGGDDHMPFDGSAIVGSDYTVAAATARTSGETFNCWLGGTTAATTNANLHLCWRSDTALTHDQHGNGYDVAVPAYGGTPTPTLVINRQAAAGGKSTHVNGAEVGTSANTMPLTSWTGSALARSENNYLAGRIGEVVIAATAVGVTDRQRLEGYLGPKWGSPLPPGHPYLTFRPLAPAGPASQPHGVSALTSGTRMEVSWTQPTYTGGTPISDYTVQYRVQGATPWTTATDAVSTDTISVLTALAAGTTYETRVAAVTGTGTGTWSTIVASVPGRAWAPNNIAGGTALWLDADDAGTFTTSAGQVDAWRDKSGAARHATQTGTARPALTAGLINGRPAVAFDGTDDALPFNGTFMAGTDYTVAAAVARTSGKIDNCWLGGTGNTTNTNLHTCWGSSALLTHSHYNNEYFPTVPAYSTPTATLVVNRHSGTGGKQTFANGSSVGSSADTTALISWNGAAVGRVEGNFFAGHVGEVVITTSDLLTADRQRLEGYLRAKWGTPLVTGHPFAGHSPLFPAGPAAAPTAVAALSDQGQASVTWTAPVDTGGTPISDYAVQYRAVGAPTWTTAVDGVSTLPRATVTGLVDGTSYEFRVAAVTAVGAGAYSAAVAAVPGRIWSPTDLPGLGLWFDADDASTFTISGTVVDQWRDKSGNNRHASQVSSNRPPLTPNTINGRPAVVFSGTDDFLPFDGSFLTGTDYTIAVAGARTSTKTDNYYLGGTTAATRSNLHLGWRADATLTHAQYADDYDVAVPGYGTRTPTVILHRRGAAGKETYADGSSLASSASTTGLVGWAGSAVGRFGTSYFAGQVGEVVITTSDLATVNRQRLEGYLAAKWGTPLPGGHPHAGGSPVLLFAYPPTGVAALTESTTMQVSWTAPTNTGGAPVTDYRVQYRVLGAPGWTTAADPVSTDTTSMITGLAAGTTYQTRVAAITANGVGAWSTHTQSSPGRAWTPADLAGGTALWFDADDAASFTTSGSSVDTWRDRSGNNRHASQTGTLRPTLTAATMNGRPAVVFDGTDDLLPFNGGFIAGSDYAIAAAVARTSNRTENYFLGGTTTTQNNNVHLGWLSDTTMRHAQWSNDYDMTVPAFTTPTATVMLSQHSATAGKSTHIDASPSGTSTNTASVGSWTGSAVGSWRGSPFAGRVGEVVVTTTTLSTPDRQRLEGYLAAKWGTPLPAGHPYATARPLSP